MDNQTEKLNALSALQDLQNASELPKRIEALEGQVASLQTNLAEVTRSLSVLSMDFHNFSSNIEKREKPLR
jgi:hypothetical protein